MTRRQRQQMRRVCWPFKPARTWKGRHGGRRDKHPAVKMVAGVLVLARSIKKGEAFTIASEQMQQIIRQSNLSYRTEQMRYIDTGKDEPS